MSRLDELIANLCPNGVKYELLEKCCTILDNKRKPVTKAAREAGEYPYYGANGIQDYVSDYIFDGTFILVGEDGSVMTSNGNPVVNWAEGKIWVNNHAHIVEEKEGVLLRYLFHYLQTVNVFDLIHGNIPKLTGRDFRAIKVPVPPLEVQREIVRVLDNFMFLTAELTAELTARRKQYEYYLDRFFEEQTDNLVPLSSIGVLTRGKRFVHSDAVDEGVPCIHYGELYTHYGTYADKVKSHIREDLRDRMRYAHKGDVIIVGAGENNVDIGIGVSWEGDEDVAVHDACYTLSHDQNSRYISYYLRSRMYHEQIKKYVSAGKICAISADGIGKSMIPLPSREKQASIVFMLSRFEALCNNLNVGLPAEISYRKRQYEYYRNMIISSIGGRLP